MLTAKQSNRLTAYENVDAELEKDPTIYQEDEGMREIAAELHEHLVILKPLRKDGVRPRKGGATNDKAEAKVLLSDIGAEIAGDLYSFGTKIKSHTLQAESNYAANDLVKLRGTRLVDVTEHLLELADTQGAAMGKLAISSARQLELRQAINDFGGKKNTARQQNTTGQAVSLSTGQRFSLISGLLKDRLQRALRKYKRSNPEFYARVTAARTVIDLPGSHTDISVNPIP
ncbi:hypothetical protein [Hymenobacter terrenus]|uniref:hypothetical protein n=1 Tax=Hymenobacter terrenus TaxID=1629124 RepID=UPI00061925DF|nr:hypothetical protein [Hymenobacter terrenus]